MDDLERCDRELAEIRDWHDAPPGSKHAYGGAIWLNDWEVEKRLIAKERERGLDMRDLNEPAKYIEKHYEKDDRLCALLIQRGKNGEETRVTQEFASAEAMASAERLAHFRAANAHNTDIYIAANTFQDGAKTRTKADVKDVRNLFLDLDENGPAALKSILASTDVPKPTSVITSSPEHYHVLWRVQGFTPAQAEATTKGMAFQFGGDPAATDVVRLGRLPGFRNCKYFRQNWCHEVSGPRSQEIHMPKDFPEYSQRIIFPVPSLAPVRAPSSSTRSHQDWGRVMRKLKNGESPEKVQAWLAQERTDKANPVYYSQRTVEQALKATQRSPARNRGRSL